MNVDGGAKSTVIPLEETILLSFPTESIPITLK